MADDGGPDQDWACEACGGRTVEQTVQLAVWIEGKLAVLDGVAALVCEDCAEQAYDDATATAIRRLISGGAGGLTPAGELRVPVYTIDQAFGLDGGTQEKT